MRLWDCCFLPVLFSACLAVPARSVAQEQPAPQDTTARPLTSREVKKREKKLRKELGDVDKMWLMEEVPDILTEGERRTVLELGTAEEREQFIEMFWRRRNSETASAINLVEEEHYRRLAYHDEHLPSGAPGRKTHRTQVQHRPLLQQRRDHMSNAARRHERQQQRVRKSRPLLPRAASSCAFQGSRAAGHRSHCAKPDSHRLSSRFPPCDQWHRSGAHHGASAKPRPQLPEQAGRVLCGSKSLRTHQHARRSRGPDFRGRHLAGFSGVAVSIFTEAFFHLSKIRTAPFRPVSPRPGHQRHDERKSRGVQHRRARPTL